MEIDIDTITLAEMYPTFATRLRTTLESLKQLPKNERWDPFLEDHDDDELVELVLAHTAQPAIEFHDQLDPPTFEELTSLPWDNTRDMGVYLKFISEKSECATHLPHWVYVGSGTSVTGGLRGRRYNHEHPPKHKYTCHYRLFNILILIL